jgi:hypothetical protein
MGLEFKSDLESSSQAESFWVLPQNLQKNYEIAIQIKALRLSPASILFLINHSLFVLLFYDK